MGLLNSIKSFNPNFWEEYLTLVGEVKINRSNSDVELPSILA
jgi:hypothetical protein